MRHNRGLFDAIKRTVDVGIGAIGLIVTFPIQLGVAAAVLVTLGRPVFFRQERPGKNSKVFELVKFRTMLLPDEDHVTDDQRMTQFGSFLRSTSLDELPTLWNVLKGDMSLVGPRPLLVRYLDQYSPEQARRHEIRPGITGLAQVSGRNRVSWDQRFQLDVHYVDNRSLKLDFRILLMTVSYVFKRTGISQVGHATMTPFTGSGP